MKKVLPRHFAQKHGTQLATESESNDRFKKPLIILDSFS